jgi:hypothetical protein
MVDSDAELSREKLIQYKIKGQTKPFVDQNLQLQIPGIESDSSLLSSTPSHLAWKKMESKLKKEADKHLSQK